MKKLILLLFFVLFHTWTSWSQIEIGTGTEGKRYPFGNYYGFERSASIYMASEVQGVGAITALAWNANVGGGPARPIKIYLKEVNESVLTAVPWSTLTTGATLVYDGTLTPVQGWNSFALTAAFNFTGGAKNLMVLVEANFGGGGGTGSDGSMVRFSEAPNKHMQLESDTTAPTTSGTVNANRPNIRITLPPPACLNPVANGGIIPSPTGVAITLALPIPALGNEYELRTTGVAGSGATGLVQTATVASNVITLSGLIENTAYKVYVRAKCTATALSSWVEIPFRTTITGQIGQGTTTTMQLPLYSGNNNNYSQQIYLKSEITAALGVNNLITKIRFHVNSSGASETSFKDWKIFMGNTTLNAFASSSSWIPNAQLTEVFDGQITFPSPTDGWMEITLATPFIWDGVGNLVIAVNEYAPGYSYGAVFRKTDTTDNRGILYTTDSPIPNLNSLPSGSLYKYVPQIGLVGNPLPACMYPLNIQYTDVTSSSVKFTWSIHGTNPILGTDYYLSTSPEGPDESTAPSDNIAQPGRLLQLSDLTENTRYYIWFRTKCSATVNSEWANTVTFKTNSLGQIGTGNELTASLPLASNYNYNFSQQIYLASEVLESVGTNRYIKKIKFHFTSSAATANYKDWKVFMGNTTKGSFAGTTAAEWVPVASMTTVFDGVVTFPNPTGDWIEITLAEPFLWDGTSNIVVGVHEYTNDKMAGANFRKMNTGTANRGLLYRVDGDTSALNLYALPAASERFTYVPQIVLLADPAPTCIGVSSYSYADLGINSVKVNWTNTTTVLGTEYYYSTALTPAPTVTTTPSGTVNMPTLFANITGLTPDTQYYVWFRNKCNATDKSAWSAIPLGFKTGIRGQVGNGNATTDRLPIYSYNSFNYSQQIYLASEIVASLGVNGQQYVTKLKFHFKTTGGTANYKDWKIFLGNTAKTEFATTAADQWVPISAMQEVFSGVIAFPDPSDTWMEIILDESFVWDGTSNIVVAVNETTPGYTSGATFRKQDTPTFRGFLHTTDSGAQDLSNPPIASYRYDFVPQIVFETTVVPSCLKPLGVQSTDVTKNTATISWRAPVNVPALGYEYEIRTSGLAGSGAIGRVATELVANTILTKALTGLTPSTEYFVYVRSKCTATSFSEWTTVRTFTTKCNYTDFTVQDAAICGQGIVNLAVTVTGTTGVFKWYDVATGGVVLSEGLTFTTPLLTANKSYWVEGVIGTGNTACLSGRKKIDVVVTAAPTFTLSTATLTICEGETSAVVTVTSDLSLYNTYTWSPATGVSGNAQTGWVFNPTTTTEYVLTAKQATGSMCESAKKVRVVVKPLPVITLTPEPGNLIICEGETQVLEASFISHFQGTIGTATTVSADYDNNTAFNNRWTSGKSQLLFTAAELTASGLLGGDISSMSFNIATAGSALTNAGYTVKIANTSLNVFPSATYVTAGFTTVYGPSTYTHTATGWQEIVFATPYAWDGVSNIIVEISSSGANSSYNANTYFTETAGNTLLSSYNTNSPEVSKKRYNVIFKGGNNYQVTWAPATNVFTDEAATVPYVAGTSAKKVYYKGQTEGYENLVMNVASGNGCPLVKTFNIRTVFITNAAAENQDFCGTVPVSDLVATGQEGAAFKWYRQATGGVVLAPTAMVTTGTYFVTQIIGTCESTTRVPVQVAIKTKPTAPISPSRNICGTAVLSDLEVTYDTDNTLNWYDANQNPIVGDIALQTGVYYVSQSNTVCESDRTRVNISVNPVPGIPTVTATQMYCGVSRVSNLAMQLAPGAVANWYVSLESTTVLSPNELLRTGVYYGAQMLNGCVSARVAVNVAVYETVALPLAQNQNFCTTNATVADLQATALPGAQLNWYNVATGGTALGTNQVLNSGLYYVSQKIGDCESARTRIGVNIVTNTTAPNVQAQSFCGETKVSALQVTVGTGYIVKWYTQEQAGTALSMDAPLQTGIYYVSQSIYFCESPRKRVEITVNPLPAAPTGSDLQVFEQAQNSVIGNLVLDQTNIVWFSSEEDAIANINSLAANMPLIDGNVYYGVIRSSAGCTSLPFAVTVKINVPLGINDFDLTKLNYYPNPVKDILTITYKETITRVEVYSLTGQRVLTMNALDNIVLVDMSRLATATYVVKIYSNNQTQFIKIVKN
ncbi:fibronectin type III domain-containing protein [Flavobacterium sp. NKUCC04_CG]|uniref:Ig-like domain-containing protein n=1 Tax=Flavobacterium sp. NKUCC04_CG TaxID=2842121 RepID=UPI001C5A7204|nr:fibronectin type III domain-containing protein [Flavobacterium sp. NKUCC04_CG]MBW3517695.1 fibronectin type III domain-containing protein [Flavobacterium sp. NKUCC04_CG]